MSHFEPFQAFSSYFEPFGSVLTHSDPVVHIGPIWSHFETFKPILTHFDLFGVVWSGPDQKNSKFDQKLKNIFFGPYEPCMDFMNNGHQVSGLDLRPEVRLG